MGRFLGPDLYGQYTIVLVIPTLLVLFSDLGINAGITKFAASLRTEGKSWLIPKIYHYGLVLRLCIGIFITILSVAFASYFALLINRPDFTFYIQIASLSVIFQVLFTTTNSAFIGLDKSEYSALATTLRAILTTLIQICLVILSFNVVGALIGFVTGYFIAAIISTIFLALRFLRPLEMITKINNINNNTKNIISILARYGMPVYISVVLVGLFPLYQQVVLAFFVSDAEIGNFRAAYNFVSLFLIVSTAITNALLPAFSKLESQVPKTINTFFHKANKFSCLLIVPITVLVIVLSEPLVHLLYGSLYSSAALFLSLNCSVYLLSIIGYLTLTSVFNGLGKTRLTLNTTLLGFIILVVLSPVLTNFYGVVGAIVSFLIAITVATSYAANIAIKQIGITFDFKSTLGIYSISFFSALPLLGLQLLTDTSPFLILVLGVIIYFSISFTLIPLMRVINIKELNTLASVIKRIPILSLIFKPILSYERKIIRFRESK